MLPPTDRHRDSYTDTDTHMPHTHDKVLIVVKDLISQVMPKYIHVFVLFLKKGLIMLPRLAL